MSKIYDGLIGLIVGDAMGVPVEFNSRDSFKVTDMTGYGTYDLPAGSWSDDSSMMLATVESIARLGEIDTDDIMKNFVRWVNDGEFTPYGEMFDIGRATRNAIQRYVAGIPAEQCGGIAEWDNGNGSLMRILPLAFTDCDYETVNAVSRSLDFECVLNTGMNPKDLLMTLQIETCSRSVPSLYSEVYQLPDGTGKLYWAFKINLVS